ncbi:chlorophyllase-1-like isoform X1 [Elysia marginata]|uniref:Chlorophyllase-1-like isoform X1 n=1 Tax=Elysia marginata TaxID=1093978 RepID=A0AAV4J3P3_9GAST|nr:chlorophyllase-1-like isoform X1 [Elysia marginata]
MESFKTLFFFAASSLLLALLPFANAQHQESPFTPGTMDIDTIYLNPDSDGCPLFTTMYYPQKHGFYAPIFFLGGIYDLISTKYYKTFLQDIAKHGYIVFGIDLYPHDENNTDAYGSEMQDDLRPPKTMVESHINQEIENRKMIPNFLEQMKWLEHHVNNRTKSRPIWEKLTLSCQSASCSIILNMVRTYPKYAAAAVFIDPVCFNSKMMKPKKVHTKTLSYVSSKSFNFPFCCVKGFGYKKVYDLMTNIKVRMSVRDFGHCGLMEMSEWSICNRTGICQSGAESQVEEYQQFTAGMMHAFIRWTLFSQVSMRRYVIDQSLMPLALDDLDYVLHPHANTTDDMTKKSHLNSDTSNDLIHDVDLPSYDKRFSVA